MKSFALIMIAMLLGGGTPVAEAQKRDGAKAGLKGNPGQFFGPDAYPQDARRAGAEGRVVAILKVDATGTVVDCTLRQSSGNASLDTQTCAIAREKVRFTPATDRRGRPIPSDYPLAVKWQLEGLELSE
ncbi:energy transducer TonB [Sphingomonas floccifaciens]|uniref:Energy transducer TonB n=1 Tax=Sphingomonas floccifaciens TaxID=1844115 RepID=A0ABW4NFV9_9SPHN